MVQASSVWKELKPEVKFLEIMQTPGGFIAGRYEIIFERPHWDNTHKFIQVMEELTQEYRLRPREEGVFGKTFEGYVKHVYQVSGAGINVNQKLTGICTLAGTHSQAKRVHSRDQ